MVKTCLIASPHTTKVDILRDHGFEGNTKASGFRWLQQLLGRPLGYFIFSLIGLKRTLFTNIFQRL